MLATVLGVIGTALGVIRAWPQVREIVCRGETAGVSVKTWGLTLLNNASWLTLGLLIAAPEVVIANALSAIGCLAVLTAVHFRERERSLLHTAGYSVAGAALVAIAAIGGSGALTVLATVLAVLMFLPQLLMVLRSNAEGVSFSTWMVTAFSSVVWVAYAFALGKPSLAACHIVILPATITIAYRAKRSDACDRTEATPVAA